MDEKVKLLLAKADAERDKAEAQKPIHRKLSRMLMQGTEYTETAILTTKNDEQFEIAIRALGDGEIAECYRTAGVSMSEFSDAKEALLKLEELIIVQCHLIARSATGEKGEQWSPDELGRWIKFGTGFPIARRILEISGLLGKPAEALESFRQEPVQSTD